MAEPQLSLKGDIWTEATLPQDELISGLRDRDKEGLGIFIVGPASVPLETRDTLPLLGIRGVNSSEDNFKVSMDSAVLVATHLESNQTLAAPASEWKEPAGDRNTNGSPSTLNVTVYGQFFVDVRKQLPGFPWRPGTFRITILLRNQKSNTIVTKLLPAAPLDDPEVAAILLKSSVTAPPQPVWPPAGLPYPNYRPEEGSPPLPDAGIAMTVVRAMVITPDAKCVLRGSFTLPALPAEIVRRGELVKPGEVGDFEASAVIPITIVAIGHKFAGPYIFPLKVPSCTIIQPGDEHPVVQGYFNIDLFELPDTLRNPQNYSLWAFSSEAIAGPAKLALVTPDMLPR